MKKAKRRIRVHALIEAVLPHLSAMPPMQRADVYEGIAEVTARLSPDLHATAHQIAAQLREADLAQLHFKNLFAEEGRDA
jgi:hypothetical protein